MPSESKSQQSAAGAALAAKRGETDPSSLYGAAKEMYDSMTEEQLADYARGSTEGKPEHVEKESSVAVPGYLAGYLSGQMGRVSAAHMGYMAGYLTRLTKKAEEEVAGMGGTRQLLAAIPYVGGGLYGLAAPAAGTSRAETGLVAGLTGGLGGLAGTGIGSVLAAYLARKAGADWQSDAMKNATLAGALLGASAGTYAGAVPMRYLMKRDVLAPSDLKELLAMRREEALRAGA